MLIFNVTFHKDRTASKFNIAKQKYLNILIASKLQLMTLYDERKSNSKLKTTFLLLE